MDNIEIPASLGAAIATEPLWLQLWLVILVLVNVGAALFAVTKLPSGWQLRKPALAIIVGFVVAGILMDWMYTRFGYVRLLGLAHLIGWSPAYVWILTLRSQFDLKTWYGRYIYSYLVVAGISLLIDAVDVLRYLLGDGELFMRWS